MLRPIFTLLLASLFIFGGCAYAKKQKHPDRDTLIAKMKAHNADPANKDNKYVCALELPTGSNIPIVVCRKQKDIDERRFLEQMEMVRLLRRSYR